MEWEDREESSNVEDRRGMSGKAIGGIAGGGGALLLIILGLVFGLDPSKFGPPPDRQQPGRGGQTRPIDPKEEKLAKFAKVILKDTEDVWKEQFRKQGLTYKPTTMVLFSGEVDTACGHADSAVGPFYCPGDSKVYLDLGFFNELERNLGAPGEFARAYVIAHEVGHHVQHLLGYSARADQMRRTPREKEFSVRLELQADYLAGVWAYHIQQKYKDKYKVLNPKDVESGLNAAAKIGDDYLQKRARGRINVESFTHGTSAARGYWLKNGMETGDFSKAKLDAFFTLPHNKVDVGLK